MKRVWLGRSLAVGEGRTPPEARPEAPAGGAELFLEGDAPSEPWPRPTSVAATQDRDAEEKRMSAE